MGRSATGDGFVQEAQAWQAAEILSEPLRRKGAAPFSAARLVGRVVAETDPLVLHRIEVGSLIIQRYGQVQVARRQPSDRRGDLIRIADDLGKVLHQGDP